MDASTLKVEFAAVERLFCSPSNPRHNDEVVPHVAATRHHRLLERWTLRIGGLDPAKRRHAALVILGCLGDSWAFHSDRALAQEAGR